MRPGEVVYLGKITVVEHHELPYNNLRSETGKKGIFVTKERVHDFHRHSDLRSLSVRSDTKYEREALREVLADYGESPWAEALRVRLKEVEAAGS